MKANDEKFRKVMDALKKSGPVSYSHKDIDIEVINKISSLAEPDGEANPVLDFLFGWTEIVWIRRSLITASFMLMAFFVYQQSVIVKKLKWLSSQTIVSSEKTGVPVLSDFHYRLRFLRTSGIPFAEKGSMLSDQQIDQLVDAIKKLQDDYDNLFTVLENSPELKEIVERKLNDKNSIKVKL